MRKAQTTFLFLLYSVSNKQCRVQSKLMSLTNQDQCCRLVKINFSKKAVFLEPIPPTVQKSV